MKIRVGLAVALSSFVVLAGCGGIQNEIPVSGTEKQTDNIETQEASRDVFAMDTYMTVTAYGEDAEAAVEEAEAEIYRLENLLSTAIGTSEIAQVNQNHGGSLTTDSIYLVERSLELYESTKGAFDITVYPVMRAWGFADQNFRVPEEEELKELLSRVDSSRIELSKDSGTIRFSGEDMEIDLGGIAKGYTSARIMDIFREHGITSGLVSLGGNVQVMETKVDGSLWRVAVQNPDLEEDYLGVLEVENKAVITSGGYERYFEENGQTYHHIIDPKTGYPAQSGLISVTIVSSDGTLADGLSTSLFIMGKDEASDFWRAHSREFEAIFVDEEKNLYVTEGIADSFSSDYHVEIIKENQ